MVTTQPTTIAGRLVLEDRVEVGRLTIEDGRIASVDLDPGPADAGAGAPIVSPGFVDVHVHGWGGHDAMDGARALDGMARALLRHGVTTFLPTAVSAPITTLARFGEGVRRWMPDSPDDGAAALGFNLEGPFLAPNRRGAHDPGHLIAPADVPRGELEPLVDGLRLMTVAPELPGAPELIAWLCERGVAVSLGHSGAAIAEARAGYAAGARSTTHLFNAMSGVDQHAPGLAVEALIDDRLFVELIADGEHVDPSLWPIIMRTKPADRLVLVSDAMSLAGMGDGRATLGGLAVEVRGARCTLVDGGALAGSVIALDDAVRNLVRSGVGLPAAVAAATRNPLALLGVTGRGRLEAGQLADLVEVDEDLRVRRVMRGGRWIPGSEA